MGSLSTSALVPILVLVCLNVLLTNAGKSVCPYGPMHRPRKISNQTCSSINATTCNADSIYRSFDGSCNNLANPLWGVPDSRYARLLPAKYGDGLYSPKLAKSGNNLPSAREISKTLYPNTSIVDGTWTLLTMQFGQFVAHDMSDAKNTTRTSVVDCCSNGTDSNKRCFPIKVPSNDSDYSPLAITCLNFTRTLTDKDSQCSGKWNSAEQLNDVNAYSDLSLVYGNDNETSASLRLYSGGLLRYEERNNQHWLPNNPTDACRTTSSDDKCYIAGDLRVNQNPQLTILQTLYLREHNRIARNLEVINPHWNDETLYQEARKINIGQYQIVVYDEWLPIILGEDLAAEKNLTYVNATGYINDYNQSVNVAVLNEHATAAYRFFHTLIEGFLNLNLENRSIQSVARISDWWLNPTIIEENSGENSDLLIRGLATEAENAPDEFHTEEITFFWLRERNATWGQDLKAIDVQRDRDHGLPSYNDIRVLFGLPRATSFANFTDVMTSESASQLEALYECPDDVDLAVGGALEEITLGQGLAGPTFKAIMAEQFLRTRIGDRFFVENSGITGFSLAQLNELRKSTISRILCDNGYDIQQMQPGGFELISNTNELGDCDALPSIDLTLWEDATYTTTD